MVEPPPPLENHGLHQLGIIEYPKIDSTALAGTKNQPAPGAVARRSQRSHRCVTLRAPATDAFQAPTDGHGNNLVGGFYLPPRTI
jgi:hypothetical protein